MKEFKEYPKRYEDVFTSPRKDKFVQLDKITIGDDEDIDEHIREFSNLVMGFQEYVFNFLVKYIWLSRKFHYDGVWRRKLGSNSHQLDGAYSLFLRKYINFSPALVTGTYLARIAGYFDDFFPNFDEGNPFKEDYSYPYKYMTFDCLILVWQIPERLDLLRIGEERKMRFLKFADYVINHTMCRNEEHEDKYEPVFNGFHRSPLFIKKVNPHPHGRTKRKRAKKA